MTLLSCTWCLTACLPAWSPCLPAGVKAQLSAAQQVRSHSGEFAALLGRGAAAVQELQQQVQDTDAAILLLKQRSLKPLMQEVAALNDGHIVVVSGVAVVVGVQRCGTGNGRCWWTQGAGQGYLLDTASRRRCVAKQKGGTAVAVSTEARGCIQQPTTSG